MSIANIFTYPTGFRSLYIKGSFIALCADAPDPRCAGAILSQFEFWTGIKMRNQGQARTDNAISIREGIEPIQDESLWIYKTEDELQAETLGLFGIKKLHDNREWLIEQGYLFCRNNPKFKWDRTLQYLLNIDRVQMGLDALSQDRLQEDADLRDDSAELRHDDAELRHVQDAELRQQYQNITHIEQQTEQSELKPTVGADAPTASPAPAEGKAHQGTQPSLVNGALLTPVEKLVPQQHTEDDPVVKYDDLSSLGKFVLSMSGRDARWQPQTLTTNQDLELSKTLQYYVDGEEKLVSANTLFDEDPEYKRWIQEVVQPVLHARSGSKRRHDPIRRERLVGAITLKGNSGINLIDFYAWRKEQERQRKRDEEWLRQERMRQEPPELIQTDYCLWADLFSEDEEETVAKGNLH